VWRATTACASATLQQALAPAAERGNAWLGEAIVHPRTRVVHCRREQFDVFIGRLVDGATRLCLVAMAIAGGDREVPRLAPTQPQLVARARGESSPGGCSAATARRSPVTATSSPRSRTEARSDAHACPSPRDDRRRDPHGRSARLLSCAAGVVRQTLRRRDGRVRERRCSRRSRRSRPSAFGASCTSIAQIPADVVALAGERPPDPWTRSAPAAAPSPSARSRRRSRLSCPFCDCRCLRALPVVALRPRGGSDRTRSVHPAALPLRGRADVRLLARVPRRRRQGPPGLHRVVDRHRRSRAARRSGDLLGDQGGAVPAACGLLPADRDVRQCEACPRDGSRERPRALGRV
jgi:hypothetical protein